MSLDYESIDWTLRNKEIAAMTDSTPSDQAENAYHELMAAGDWQQVRDACLTLAAAVRRLAPPAGPFMVKSVLPDKSWFDGTIAVSKCVWIADDLYIMLSSPGHKRPLLLSTQTDPREARDFRDIIRNYLADIIAREREDERERCAKLIEDNLVGLSFEEAGAAMHLLKMMRESK